MLPDQRLQPVEAVEHDGLELVRLVIEAADRLQHFVEAAQHAEGGRADGAEPVLGLEDNGPRRRRREERLADAGHPIDQQPWRGKAGAAAQRGQGDRHQCVSCFAARGLALMTSTWIAPPARATASAKLSSVGSKAATSLARECVAPDSGTRSAWMPHFVWISTSARSRRMWDELFPGEQERILRLLVERVTVTDAGAEIRLNLEGLAGLARDMAAKEAIAA
jgi:hypothetical protein